jgi:hypothetical protein
MEINNQPHVPAVLVWNRAQTGKQNIFIVTIGIWTPAVQFITGKWFGNNLVVLNLRLKRAMDLIQEINLFFVMLEVYPI